MEDKKIIKLIGMDLDGTLLDDNKQLCDGARETLAAAKARGIQLVPITGRPLTGIPDCIRQIPEIDYYICSNGAQIIDAKTEKSILSYSISNSKSRKIINILRSYDCMFEPFTDGVAYSEQAVYDYYIKQYTGTPLEDYVVSSRRITDSIEELFVSGQRTTDDFFVNCATPAIRDELLEKIEALGDLQICLLGDRFAEITDKNADKGTALQTLCDYLHIDIKNTMAFGDGENDLLLMDKAGIAVAMGNAFLAVKEKAAIIADTNNNNGVCKIIEQILN